MIDYKTATISDLHFALVSGEITAKDLLKIARKTISEIDGEIGAFLEVFGNSADQDAKRADEIISSGNIKLLTGIPIAIKDNLCSEGNIVTCASKILKNFVSPFSATVVSALREEGVVIVGRTNMDEFAMGSSCENSAYQTTKNPKDITRVPGGSSGGSAAAVSAGMVPIALGSDTGGSIRQPASFCGVIGLKPTYGAVSRYGLIALGSSLDVIGLFARSTEDSKFVFDVMANFKDEYDSTYKIYSAENGENKNKKIIGVPSNLDSIGVSKEVMKTFEKTLDGFREKGYKVVSVDIQLMDKAGALYYIIQPAEASSNLARFDGVRYGVRVEANDLWSEYVASRSEGFGDEVTRRIVTGTYVLSAGYYDAYYKKAIEARSEITKEFINAFKEVEVIMTPTTPGPAFELNSKNDPLSMYAEDRLTLQANLTGLPAMSVPMKNEGLPLGLQIIGCFNSEDTLFKYSKEAEGL